MSLKLQELVEFGGMPPVWAPLLWCFRQILIVDRDLATSIIVGLSRLPSSGLVVDGT